MGQLWKTHRLVLTSSALLAKVDSSVISDLSCSPGTWVQAAQHTRLAWLTWLPPLPDQFGVRPLQSRPVPSKGSSVLGCRVPPCPQRTPGAIKDTRQDFSASHQDQLIYSVIPGDFVGWVGMEKMESRPGKPFHCMAPPPLSVLSLTKAACACIPWSPSFCCPSCVYGEVDCNV